MSLAKASVRVQRAAKREAGTCLDIGTKYLGPGNWLVKVKTVQGWRYYRVVDAIDTAEVRDEISSGQYADAVRYTDRDEQINRGLDTRLRR